MGIRCECPNGHPLHVKDVLAGKRGVCPKCGEKFIIPAESLPEPAPAVAATEQAEAAAPAREADPPSVEIPVEAPAARPSPARAIPKATPKSEPAPAGVSANAEAPPPPPAEPAAEWYARLPGGEQLGPATEEAFKEWLASGQVTADSYVWRTGWVDWKRVDQATADLPQVGVAGTPIIPAPAAKPEGPSAAARYAKRRAQAGKRQLISAVFLGIMALGLGGVLAYVLSTNQASAPAADASTAPVEQAPVEEAAEEANEEPAGEAPADDAEGAAVVDDADGDKNFSDFE